MPTVPKHYQRSSPSSPELTVLAPCPSASCQVAGGCHSSCVGKGHRCHMAHAMRKEEAGESPTCPQIPFLRFSTPVQPPFLYPPVADVQSLDPGETLRLTHSPSQTGGREGHWGAFPPFNGSRSPMGGTGSPSSQPPPVTHTSHQHLTPHLLMFHQVFSNSLLTFYLDSF